jgi:hypothetical protein
VRAIVSSCFDTDASVTSAPAAHSAPVGARPASAGCTSDPIGTAVDTA